MPVAGSGLPHSAGRLPPTASSTPFHRATRSGGLVGGGRVVRSAQRRGEHTRTRRPVHALHAAGAGRQGLVNGRGEEALFDPPHHAGKSRRRYVWDLRNKIAEASAIVDREIEEAQRLVDSKTELLAAKIDAEEDAAAHVHAVEAAKDAGVERFLAGIVERNQRIAELKTERDMVILDRDEHKPYWMTRLKDVTKYVASVAHTHGWRAAFKDTIRELQEMFAEDEKEGLYRPLQECIENINAWKAAAFKQQLEKVYTLAYQQELARPSAYSDAVKRLERVEADMAALIKELDTKQKADMAEVAALKAEHNTSRAVAEEVQTLEIGADGQVVLPEINPGDVVQVPPSIEPYLRRYCQLHDLVDAKSQMKVQFHRMLVYCVQAGAWQDAFRTYGAMLRTRTQPDQSTFQMMIAACKSASPPHSAASVAVLAEMRRQRLDITTTMFNRVIDACRLEGAWRRALTVFQALREAGCTPTTATYQVLGEACAQAARDDVPDVYTAMKYSGVPEFLAYSVSMKAVEGLTPKRGKRKKPRKGVPGESLSSRTNVAGMATGYGGGMESTFESSASSMSPAASMRLGMSFTERDFATTGKGGATPIFIGSGTMQPGQSPDFGFGPAPTPSRHRGSTQQGARSTASRRTVRFGDVD